MRTTASGKSALDVFTCMDAHVTEAMWDTAGGNATIHNVAITPLDGTSPTQTFPTGDVARWQTAQAGDFVPGLATLIKLGTAFRGRDNRGRVFLPFTSESAQDAGMIGSAEATAVGNAWVAFQTAIEADATTPMAIVVASYDRRHAGAGAHAHDVIRLSCELPCATQRRRQGRLRGA